MNWDDRVRAARERAAAKKIDEGRRERLAQAKRVQAILARRAP